MNNLHISLTNLKNESRILKETKTLITHKIFKQVYIVGLGENGLTQKEKIDEGREINRIFLKTRNFPKNIFFQLIKYIEYLIIVLTKYKNKNIHAVNIHSLSLLPIGVLYKVFYKVMLVYDAHEYETERQGLFGVRKWLSKVLEKSLINYCDHVIVVSDSIADEYKMLYPMLVRPNVILNTPEYKAIAKQDIFREALGIKKEQTIFLYQGGLSRGRGIEVLLEAFKQIKNSKPIIVFMGYGMLEKKIKEYATKYNNIYFHEAVDPDVLLEYTSSADFGISTIEDSCLSYRYCLPNKIFEYVMANVPVIVSNLPEMSKIVNTYHIGFVLEENTAHGLMSVINDALLLNKGMIQNNLKKVQSIYNWEEQEKVLLKVYDAL